MKKIRVFPQDGINSPCYTHATAHLPNQEFPLLYCWYPKTGFIETQSTKGHNPATRAEIKITGSDDGRDVRVKAAGEGYCTGEEVVGREGCCHNTQNKNIEDRDRRGWK